MCSINSHKTSIFQRDERIEDIIRLLRSRISKDQWLKQFESMDDDPIDSLVGIGISNDKDVAWRAIWIIQALCTFNDERLQVHTDDLLDAIKDKPDGHQRELLKLLGKIQLNETQEGKLYEHCADIWVAVRKSPSVRITALKHLATIVSKYPDLRNELQYFADTHYLDSLSPGIRKSAIRTINSLRL